MLELQGEQRLGSHGTYLVEHTVNVTEDDMVGWQSPTQWTWVWVNSRSYWWTGRPGVLWFMGSQRVGHDWATEMDWMYTSIKIWIPWWQDLCLGLVDIVIFPSYCVSLYSHTLFENCSVFCCCSVAKLFPNLCDFMDCSTPGSSVLHCLLEFAHIHVHWVSDAI